MKKILVPIIAAALILIPTGVAFAAPYDFEASARNQADSADTPFTLTPSDYSDGVYEIPAFLGGGFDGSTPYGSYHFIGLGSGISGAGGNISATINTIETSDGHLSNTLTNLQNSINSFGTPFSMAVFMPTEATSSLYLATATTTGFMAASDKSKLNSFSLPTASTSTHSIVTGTGATGFQVSSTRPSNDCYSITVTSGSTLLAAVYGTVVLEIAPTNSATATDWVILGSTGGGDTVGLLHNGTNTGQICGFVPAGYFAKLRSVTGAGTPTYSYNSGQEVIW